MVMDILNNNNNGGEYTGLSVRTAIYNNLLCIEFTEIFTNLNIWH